MTLPFSPYQEIVDIAMRFAPGDGEFSTDIGNLHVSRRSRPSDPLHSSYKPCFAFVLQGAKSLRLGDEFISYGTGDYLLTSLDLPVAWRIAEATSATVSSDVPSPQKVSSAVMSARNSLLLP